MTKSYVCLQRIPKFFRIIGVIILLLEILSRFHLYGNIGKSRLILVPCVFAPETSLNLSLIGSKKESRPLTPDFYRNCYEKTGDLTCKLMINCSGMSKEPCSILTHDDLRKYEDVYGDCTETRRFLWFVTEDYSSLPCKRTN
jgi:hypothetical protein